MAKPTDLKNNFGLGGAAGAGGAFNPFAAQNQGKKDTRGDSVAAKKPHVGHDLGKGAGKTKGGAGGAGGRPKV